MAARSQTLPVLLALWCACVPSRREAERRTPKADENRPAVAASKATDQSAHDAKALETKPSGSASGDDGAKPATRTATPLRWPSSRDPLGHRHPECLATYGKTPAEIEATPCGIPDGGDVVPAGSTYSACHHEGILDFQGDDITLDCVKWDTGTVTFGTRCESSPCNNIVLRRTTVIGSNRTASQLLILLTSRGGQPLQSLLIEKCDISRTDVAIMCGSAVNGDAHPLRGEGDKALVIRDSRIHGTTESPTAHTDLLFLAEGCRGVLVERNLWDASDAIGGSNVGSVVQVQAADSAAGNYVFRKNRFVHDGSGHMFNFDRAYGTGPDACAAPIVFESNVFDWTYDASDGYSDVLFNYATAGRECPRIESRPGSSCSENRFANGSAARCTSDGR